MQSITLVKKALGQSLPRFSLDYRKFKTSDNVIVYY